MVLSLCFLADEHPTAALGQVDSIKHYTEADLPELQRKLLALMASTSFHILHIATSIP